VLSLLTHLIPESAKLALKAAWTRHQFQRALEKVAEVPPGRTPTPALLAQLRLAWANDGYAGSVEYLTEVASQAVAASGPILECGSGLSTILLGLLAARRGIDVWSLEHLPEWHARVVAVLESLDVPTKHLCLSPLRSYGEFDWYDLPVVSMPREFRLVICDGPPGTNRGGRYGLLPVMRARLARHSLVLLDDATRLEEQLVIRRWAAEAGWSMMRPPGSSSSFAVIST
jgi:hypothetical protein